MLTVNESKLETVQNAGAILPCQISGFKNGYFWNTGFSKKDGCTGSGSEAIGEEGGRLMSWSIRSP
jgi:hypothetical protein